MKMTKWTGLVASFVLSIGIGCGNAGSAATGADVAAVTGGEVSGEQLALPDGDGPCGRDGAGRVRVSEIDRLKALLSLTEDQVAQIQPILDATRTAVEAVRAQVKAGTLTRADAHTQIKALHDAQKTQILALLTADQQAKFTALRDHHSGPFDLDRLTTALGLSADQVTQIGAIETAAQAKISDLHAQVEAGTLTAAEAHTQIDQILTDARTAIEALLTAEQQTTLATLLAAHGHGPGGPGGRH